MKQLRAYKGNYDLVVEKYNSSYATPLTEKEFLGLLPVGDEDYYVDGLSIWFI